MLSLIFIIATAYSNPILSISKYESPPTRWITNGVLIVGVTDGECITETKIKQQSKWGAGNTFTIYKAPDILKNLNKQFYTTVHAPYSTLDSGDETIEASLEFYYGNCKILVKNESDITDHEYFNSYTELANCANKHLYNSAESLDNDNKKKNNNHELSSEFIAIIFGSILGGSIVLICLYLFISAYCCNKN
jgi:hypothetical protein